LSCNKIKQKRIKDSLDLVKQQKAKLQKKIEEETKNNNAAKKPVKQ